jgi:alkylation response protein AidB-like acyl-CoA dehydrogenase
VETKAKVDGDQVVITGTKVWTSGAARANMMFALCRSDPDLPKHAGLSYVLFPFKEPEVTYQPIRQLSGASEFCQDFINEVRVPLFNVIGGLNNGWRVAMTTLGNERGGRATTMHLRYEREFWELVETARKQSAADDRLVRQDLAWAYSQVELMRYSGLRLLSALAAKREPGPEASVNKLFWSEYHKRFGNVAINLVGAQGMIRPAGDGYRTDRWQQVFLGSRAGTIFSGTSEIQRNIIAERSLGLPKEPLAAGQ